jgi:deglycase
VRHDFEKEDFMPKPKLKAAVLVYDLFEQAEFEEPLQALKNAGIEVTVISASQKNLQAMRHNKPSDTFQADLLLDDARFGDYDALILPGGALNADRLRMDKKARLWVSECIDQGKLIAAICHAPWLLVSADAVEERRLTSYYTLQDDIRNAGGEWVDLPVVIDGNIITSRMPDDLEQFDEAIIAWLKHPAATASHHAM